jgi:hypothetical protein
MNSDISKNGMQLLFASLVLIVLISSLHIYAGEKYLYFLYWWFDIVMHFLGGVWVGVTFLWLYFFSRFFGQQAFQKGKVFKVAIISFVIVGLSWEIFEVFIGVPIYEPNYIFDTVSDLIVGTLGVLVFCKSSIFKFLKREWARVLS